MNVHFEQKKVEIVLRIIYILWYFWNQKTVLLLFIANNMIKRC